MQKMTKIAEISQEIKRKTQKRTKKIIFEKLTVRQLCEKAMVL
jgi:hypothetical protein